MIRTSAGMSTSGFSRVGVAERTYRRWQARARAGWPANGPWPAPVVEAVEPTVVKYAEKHPAWGHRKVWALRRHDGLRVSPSTVERVMRARGLLQERDYTAELRQLRRDPLRPGSTNAVHGGVTTCA